MLRFYIKQTDEYERLIEFLKPMGLEFSDEEIRSDEYLRAWKVIQEPDYLVGCAILSKRAGEFYVSGIGVDLPMRRTGIGRILMNKLINEVRKMGGERIYLIAKVPEFFETLGFDKVEPEDAPDVSKCPECEQYNVKCYPVIMKKEL